VLLTRRHIGILSISDSVSHSDFQDVRARCDFHCLRLLGNFLRLTRLHAIDEYLRTHRRTDDDQLSRIWRVRFPMKPATARDA
jgi:hypothetical protein